MSLGTGALKVSRKGPEEYKHCKGDIHGNPASGNHPGSSANRHHHTETSPVEILTKADTYLLSQVALGEGRAGLSDHMHKYIRVDIFATAHFPIFFLTSISFWFFRNFFILTVFELLTIKIELFDRPPNKRS